MVRAFAIGATGVERPLTMVTDAPRARSLSSTPGPTARSRCSYVTPSGFRPRADSCSIVFEPRSHEVIGHVGVMTQEGSVFAYRERLIGQRLLYIEVHALYLKEENYQGVLVGE